MRRLRLHLTGRPDVTLRDTLRGLVMPSVWDSDGLKVEFYLADLEDARAPFDLTTISALTLEIRAAPTIADLLAGPIPPDAALAACTYDDWKLNATANKHGSFTLTGIEMDFINSLAQFWLSIRATITDGEPVTFGAGWVKVFHSGHGGTAIAYQRTFAVTEGIASFRDVNGAWWNFGPVSPAVAPVPPPTTYQDAITITDGIATFEDASENEWVIGPVSAGTEPVPPPAVSYQFSITITDGIATFRDAAADWWTLGPVSPAP